MKTVLIVLITLAVLKALRWAWDKWINSVDDPTLWNHSEGNHHGYGK